MNNKDITVQEIIDSLNSRVDDCIIERSNADLLIKLIKNAESLSEAIEIAELGTTYKKTGFHFDKRLEKKGDTIKYLKRNEELSISDGTDTPHHMLLIGDNYDALQNLLISHRGAVDIIYIDPPYAMDSDGEFAKTNYENAITRDNLLSMLYPRLWLAKQLLTDDGIIFCSIDDRNLAYVIGLFNEVFTEKNQLFVAPRQTKKGGKTTKQIQKNHDYIVAFSKRFGVVFELMDFDGERYNLTDEYEEERGKYKLTQTLDYDSLQYSSSLDYEIELDGKKFVPGGDVKAYKQRQKGDHQAYDWAWRWSEDMFNYGVKNGFVVVKESTQRIYTKTYEKAKIEKVAGEYQVVTKNKGKAYSTLAYLDNEYSNDNAKKELDLIFVDSTKVFKNPKPSELILQLIKMVNSSPDITVLDFFAGSGTTGHAVLRLNEEDGGSRRFILCTNNEITDINPNGIALDATTKRLKRVMTGSCYNGTADFPWAENNDPLGGNLDVYDIDSVASFNNTPGESAFDVIDETAYGLPKFDKPQDKIHWVCNNFDNTQNYLEDKDA